MNRRAENQSLAVALALAFAWGAFTPGSFAEAAEPQETPRASVAPAAHPPSIPETAGSHSVRHPEFYDRIDPITLRDPLSDFLGATEDGAIVVRYIDAVQVAGHSCPTVAGAWLMAGRALRELYGEDIPVRGEIEVQMRDEPDMGVCGVIASVFTQVTGAAAEGGFHGVGGQFSRRNLLSFGQDVDGVARFVRKDTGKSVTVGYDHAAAPEDPEMMPLMKKSLSGQATPEEEVRFRELWVRRIEAILLDHADELVSAHVEEG